MKRRPYVLTVLLLATALLMSGCGSKPETGTSATTTTTAAVQDGSTTSAVDTASTTAAGADTTTTTAQITLPQAEPATHNAREILLDMLQKGEVADDAVWKPVYLDANCISGWKDMVTNDESFSMKTLDFALPYVFVTEKAGGIVLNANQWANGGLYWDKAGIAYYATGRCRAKLHAGDIKTIAAASESDAGALTKTEGRVEIYLNDEKIWPADKDYAVVKSGAPIDFPELELDLYPGDVVVIAAYGAAPGEDIKADTGGSWQNHILLDPVMEILG